MAKSLVMGGQHAGFNMGSEAGPDAFMRTMQSRSLASPGWLPPPASAPHHVDKAAARAKKNQRKTERKARRKNR